MHENLRQWATPDLASAWDHYHQLYRDIVNNIPETPSWYPALLLEQRNAFADELDRRKRKRLALAVDFTSSVNFIDKEDIRAATDIVALISESTELRRVGRGKYRGCCPLHGGDNPTSLDVNANKLVWHCHACHLGGDVFEWISYRDGVNFIDALKILAERAGMTAHNGRETSAPNVFTVRVA